MRGKPQARIALLRERTPVPSEQEAGCASNPIEMFWGREKYLSPAGIRTAGRPSRGLATLPNTLSRLPLLLSVSRLVHIDNLQPIILHNTHTIIHHTLLYGALLTRNWVLHCSTDGPVGRHASSVVRFTARSPVVTRNSWGWALQAHGSVQQCSYKLYCLYLRTGAFSRF